MTVASQRKNTIYSFDEWQSLKTKNQNFLYLIGILFCIKSYHAFAVGINSVTYKFLSAFVLKNLQIIGIGKERLVAQASPPKRLVRTCGTRRALLPVRLLRRFLRSLGCNFCTRSPALVLQLLQPLGSNRLRDIVSRSLNCKY